MPEKLVNIEKVKKFIEEKKLNPHRLAISMSVDYSYVTRVLKGECNPGPKFINGLKKACKEYNRDFKEFIFLD